MVPGPAILAGGSLLLLGAATLGHLRGWIASCHLPALLGLGAVGLSYSLLRLTRTASVPTGSALDHGLDAVAVVLLVAGAYGLYRWWRARDPGSSPPDR